MYTLFNLDVEQDVSKPISHLLTLFIFCMHDDSFIITERPIPHRSILLKRRGGKRGRKYIECSEKRPMHAKFRFVHSKSNKCFHIMCRSPSHTIHIKHFPHASLTNRIRVQTIKALFMRYSSLTVFILKTHFRYYKCNVFFHIEYTQNRRKKVKEKQRNRMRTW